MRALVLAAGRGERMRPLTDTVAKPLLMAGGRRLIEWQIEALVRAGIRELVVNTAHLAQQIEDTLGDGARYGANIRYSREGTQATDALETLGGIVRALPLLGEAPFVLVSSDIVTTFDYGQLRAAGERIAAGAQDAHLELVENPPYHPEGDMGLIEPNPAPDPATRAAPGRAPAGADATRVALATRNGTPRHTYANIGVLAPRLFAGLAPVRARLFPWLYGAVDRGRVSAHLLHDRWWNVGTPQDLAAVDAALR